MTKPILTLLFLLISTNTILSQEENKKNFDPGLEKAERYLKVLQEHYAVGDYHLHKDYSDSLLVVSKKYSLTKMHVLALVNQAVFHNNRDERLKSIKLYHEALEQCKLIPEDFRSRTIVLVNMGNTYNNIGSYEKAITTMKKVLVVVDSTENSDRIKAAALVGLSTNYAELGNYEKTLEYAKKANALGERIQSTVAITTSLNSIIDAYVNMEQYDKAIEIGEKALKLSSPEKSTKSRGWLLLNLGIANYHIEEFDTSLDFLKNGVALAQEKDLAEIEMLSHEYLAKIYELKQDYKASFASQKRYSLLKDKFLKDKKDASNADLKMEITSKDEAIFENEEALQAAESKRNKFIIWSTVVVIILSGLLFFYIKRKKAIEVEEKKLRAQYLGLQQTILNKDKGTSTNKLFNTANGDDDLKPYKNSSLTPEKREVFKNKILAFMDEEKPFLSPDLNQSDLASSIGISTHHFSEVLHYGFKQNFYNFINSYRIIEAQKLMQEEKYKNAKIIAIAFDSGFKSKTSFNRVFKKYSGQTPSEYRAKI